MDHGEDPNPRPSHIDRACRTVSPQVPGYSISYHQIPRIRTPADRECRAPPDRDQYRRDPCFSTLSWATARDHHQHTEKFGRDGGETGTTNAGTETETQRTR